MIYTLIFKALKDPNLNNLLEVKMANMNIVTRLTLLMNLKKLLMMFIGHMNLYKI